MFTRAHQKLSRLVHQWLPLVAVITLTCLLVYIAVQQNYRQNANDPQIQLAEDVAGRLAGGEPASSIIRPGQIDIATSISPFVAIFDESGKLAISSGTLDGQPLSVPDGVFQSTKTSGENRLTWQPRVGVRQAIIVTHYSGAQGSGYVVAGRSLREVERRIDLLSLQVMFAWCAMMILTALLIVLFGEVHEPHGLEKIFS